MPFDALMVCAVTQQMQRLLPGGRIDKIYQPEADEIIVSVRTGTGVYRVLLSAGASHARICFTALKPETPLTPPVFCMLLRKYLSNARITAVFQHHFDRIVEIDLEALDEMGDRKEFRLICEMMGKHSNLILTTEEGKILDAVRHVGPSMSSVRQIEPGLIYHLPTHNQKTDPRSLLEKEKEQPGIFQKTFCQIMEQTPSAPADKQLYTVFYGFSPFAAGEVLCRARMEERKSYQELTDKEKERLAQTTRQFLEEQISQCLHPLEKTPYQLYTDADGLMREFSLTPYISASGLTAHPYHSLTELLDTYYAAKDTADKIGQKSQDLRHFLKTNLERAQKKYTLQEKQLSETKDREKYRLYGDLVTANLYQLRQGMTRVQLPDYYHDGKIVNVLLDARLTPAQNAQRFYAKYNKLKRTESALEKQTADTKAEMDYLESVLAAADMADCEQDLEDIRAELYENGYLHNPRARRKNLKKSRPLSFITSEGVRGQIGKNNIQNDELTMKTARDRDLWFHVKNRPGSHVILFVNDLKEGEDYTRESLLEAAAQAGLHSSGDPAGVLEVDYTYRQYVKKPSGSRPGFVRYTHQKTILVRAEEMRKARSQLQASTQVAQAGSVS